MPSPVSPRTVLTHAQPDGDALAALWLADTFLFAGEAVLIRFVSRSVSAAVLEAADCVVDVGNTWNPARLRFDHKPPAFTDRNTSCAARLVWDYLMAQNKPVAHLSDWVAVVHEGDANPPRPLSPALRESRQSGYHATVSRARQTETRDADTYAVVRAYLDVRFFIKPQTLGYAAASLPNAPP